MTPEQLKASILQYAIQGKLIEQRPEEGTGEEFYQQMQTDKQTLIREKKIKKEKPLPDIIDDEIPFDVPESWKWVKVGFDFYDFTFCPCCGSLMPYSLKKLKGFFEVYNIHAALSDAVQLIYKSEFESAAREAFVAVENYLKKKSGLDLHGFDLATRALSFEIDKQTGEIKRAPLIAINDLKNESERNEQDGIRYMLMGFFQGPRNLYQHNHIGSGVSNSISVIIEASFFLNLLDGHSITQNGRWIPEKVDYREIYQKMPKRIDRWKLVRLLKKRDRRLKKNP